LFVAAAMVLLLASCGGGAPGEQELADSLVDSGLSEQVATCAAEALFENMSSEEIDLVAERGGGGAPVDDPDRTDDTADKVREALVACQALIETTSTLPFEPPAPADPGAGPATTLPTSGPDPNGAVIDTTVPVP